MPVPSTIQFRGNIYGKRVFRPSANLPQGGAGALFTITGGPILVGGIFGRVTTILGAVANAGKLVSNPTVGADQDLCATVELNAKPVGTMLTITGLFTDALIAAGAAASGPVRPVVVSAGTIDLNCVGSTTGQIQWTMFWVPLASGVIVSAA